MKAEDEAKVSKLEIIIYKQERELSMSPQPASDNDDKMKPKFNPYWKKNSKLKRLR